MSFSVWFTLNCEFCLLCAGERQRKRVEHPVTDHACYQVNTQFTHTYAGKFNVSDFLYVWAQLLVRPYLSIVCWHLCLCLCVLDTFFQSFIFIWNFILFLSLHLVAVHTHNVCRWNRSVCFFFIYENISIPCISHMWYATVQIFSCLTRCFFFNMPVIINRI